jgi:hypothetical protein
MSESHSFPYAGAAVRRPWDARLARRLITPLKNSRVTPNTLTTVRLGLALSLAKRAREILLGLPGLLYLHLAERAGAAATRPVPP